MNVTARKVESHMVRIDYVAVKQYEVNDVSPGAEPLIFVRTYNNILKALFIIILLLEVFEAALEVVTTLIVVVETVHISLLLGLIRLI